MNAARTVWRAAALPLLVAVSAALGCGRGCRGGAPASPSASSGEALARARCVACHRLPGPEVLPRAAWREVLSDMTAILERAGSPLAAEERSAIERWYAAQAPELLPVRRGLPGATPSPLAFGRLAFAPRGAPPVPGISHLWWADLYGDARPELVATDMRSGLVLVGHPWQDRRLRIVARLPHPSHVEACDLDGDRRRDLVVADLGTIEPADHHRGQVVWLRREGRGFRSVQLAGGLGRVADVRPVDLDGDRDLDLLVAVFGFRATGRLLWLEQRREAAALPGFVVHEIDPRHGAVACEARDLDGDGALEVIALFAQEHEALVAYELHREGEGGLRFAARTLWRAPHPAWGSSGMRVADLDGDGDLDVVLANGDVLDDHRLKPYHGLRWVEQRPGGRWVPHELAPMYGVYGVEVADLDGDGDRDVLACAMLPHLEAEQRAALDPPSVLWLEQIETRRFVPHVLERQRTDHASLAAGDMDGDGRVDLALGNLTAYGPERHPIEAWITVLRNLGGAGALEGAARRAGDGGERGAAVAPAPSPGRESPEGP
ncbi:MAG: VCBS repeat-containing protein [Planctomycetota bacterium]|nr:MAG: VCBS repeat-containing protein [Planctomycetota bacterium]